MAGMDWFKSGKGPLYGLVAVAIALSSSTALAKPMAPYSKGDVEKGELGLSLYRGNANPFEITSPVTPNNCGSTMDLVLKWDAEENTLDVHLSGDRSLEPYPNLYRTEGVDFFPNPFHPEAKDVEGGRYQLWLISASGPLLNFYYDMNTAELLGSELDFEVPPANAIPVAFPTLYLVPTAFFQPKNAQGDVNYKQTWEYDNMIRGDRADLSHFYITFPPPNLCFANPFRLDLSLLRPYLSDPRPASEARPWSDYLRGGLLFDVTAEPEEYYHEPPRATFFGMYMGTTAVGGGVPNGWKLDIDAAFMGVAPPIRPWHGAGKCEQTFEPMHTLPEPINFCALMAQAAQ
ncbi:MAG: hypothetical protein R3B09_15040 [Nannocystaceae bacterium]